MDTKTLMKWLIALNTVELIDVDSEFMADVIVRTGTAEWGKVKTHFEKDEEPLRLINPALYEIGDKDGPAP
jgi:hypothetical protein